MDQIVGVPLHVAKKYCHWVRRFHMKPTQFIELCGVASFTDATWESQILKSVFSGLYMSLQSTQFNVLPSNRNHFK